MCQHKEQVRKAAHLIVERFNRAALQEIDRRIDELLAHGEEDAVRLWKEIRAAADALLGDGGAGKTH